MNQTFALLKWNSCEVSRVNRKLLFELQLPGGFKGNACRAQCISHIYICLCMTVMLSLCLSPSLSPSLSSVTLSDVPGGRFSSAWWPVGCKWDQVADLRSRSHPDCPLLLPSTQFLCCTCACAAASCWFSIINCLISWPSLHVVSQHRIPAGLHTSGLCRLSSDRSADRKSGTLCQRRYNYNWLTT